MIKSLSELLRSVQKSEASRLNGHRITHGPTIGNMYEGLTKDLIDKVLPAALDIRVVEGFIDGIDRTLSPQADILVVHGDGERIPYTDSFIYPVGQVLAIFEIKKNLTGNELDDAMMKMGKVFELYRAWWISSPRSVDLESAVRAYAMTTGHWPLGDDGVAQLPHGLGVLFDAFKLEQEAPVRVIWGYGGYKSETTLRAGYINAMNTTKSPSSYSPLALPSLIVSGDSSLVKMAGQPYSSRLAGEWWHVLTSTDTNPVRVLLELLWTKMNVISGVQFPMDDTLNMERMAVFLNTCSRPHNGVYKWHVDHTKLTAAKLNALSTTDWKPEKLDENDVTIMLKPAIDLNDVELNRYAAEQKFDLRAKVTRLVESRHLAWTTSTTLKRINPSSIISFSPDGSITETSNAELFGLWMSERARRNEPM